MLESLNQPQREAVEFCDGPSLVVAGAGSGKTRVLTYKIAYLLQLGLAPWSILALTFTNKAANEMKRRIAQIVGTDSAKYLWMGTFHSVFLRILRTEYDRIGFSPNFTIYDAADSKSLVKSIIKEMKLDDKTYKASTVLNRICDAKNQAITAEEYAQSPGNYQYDMSLHIPRVRDIYLTYARRCRQADAMDFDDILMYTYILLRDNQDIRQKYEERFHYVLVDEYQDTNTIQHQIVLQLTEHRQRVCVVGDDAQSIYSFRGARIDNILTFQSHYPGTRLFKLEQNYRSTQMIVDAANSLIHKNRGQIEKNVFSRKEEGEKINILETSSDIEEAIIVVKNIQTLRSRDHLDYSDFAVLYRTNAQSRLFEENLRKAGIPYRIYGGLSFYQRKEIKDIISYFRLAVNPNDEEALKRIINYPARGIGQTTIAKIVTTATAHDTSLWNVLTDPERYALGVTKATLAKLSEFVGMAETFIDKAATSTAEEAGQFIVKKSGVLTDIYSDTTPENLSRQENVEELINGLADFCHSRLEEGNQNISLSDYLSEVSLLSDVDSDDSEGDDKVTLMTIHSAKGLEFNTVYIVGLEENLFPGQLCGNNPSAIEEERRLFYVAITRAEQHCTITYARSRYHYGKTEFSNPSRFLGDIDRRYTNYRTSMSRSSIYDDVQLPWQRRTARQQDWRPDPVTPSSRPFGKSLTPLSTRPLTTVSASNASEKPKSQTTAPQTSAAKSPTAQTSATQSQHQNLAVGQSILHERFGAGVIQKIEGEGDSLKATVQFQHAGTKQLLVKFARFKLI